MIARELGTYPNKVRRALLSFWPELRDRSKAQVCSRRAGVPHPTAGFKHSPETINLLRRLALERSQRTQPAGKCQHDAAIARWKYSSVFVRRKLKRRGKRSAQKSRKGSKAEQFFLEALSKCGFKVQHRPGHCDIFLLEYNVALFIDGIPLFKPIWGEEHLVECQIAAAIKRVLCLERNQHVIRVCIKTEKPSQTYMDRLLERVLQAVESTKSQTPSEYHLYGEA